jgi:hypothetical protein
MYFGPVCFIDKASSGKNYQEFWIKIFWIKEHCYYHVNENLRRMRLEEHVAQIEAR